MTYKRENVHGNFTLLLQINDWNWYLLAKVNTSEHHSKMVSLAESKG